MCTEELDSFEAAEKLVAAGYAPAVLNMANEYNCGGAWCDHNGSQEEHLFRASSLPLSLWPLRRLEDTRLPEFDGLVPRAPGGPRYPWSEATCIYSPNVVVTASATKPTVACVSCAAQDLRDYKPHYAGPFDAGLTGEKLRSILWTAAHHGHQSVVLGAFGCGAFQNEPERIASLFAQLLTGEGEFAGRFRIVVFAIIKSQYNLSAFAEHFPLQESLDDALARVLPEAAVGGSGQTSSSEEGTVVGPSAGGEGPTP